MISGYQESIVGDKDLLSTKILILRQKEIFLVVE